MKRLPLPHNALLIPRGAQWPSLLGLLLQFLVLALTLYSSFGQVGLLIGGCIVVAACALLWTFGSPGRETCAIVLEEPGRIVLISLRGHRTPIDLLGYSHVMTRTGDDSEQPTQLHLAGRKGRLTLALAPAERVDDKFLSYPTYRPNSALQGYRALISQHTGLLDGGHSTIP